VNLLLLFFFSHKGIGLIYENKYIDFIADVPHILQKLKEFVTGMAILISEASTLIHDLGPEFRADTFQCLLCNTPQLNLQSMP
jgi:hypothetical protein